MRRPIPSVIVLLALLLASAAPAAAQTYQTLHAFSGDDGLHPIGALIQATDGAFYGTTYDDGGITACGTVVRLARAGAPIEVVHRFDNEASTSEGCHPNAGLVQATDGALYGVTSEGGAYSNGTLFKVDTTQTPAVLTVIHAFADPTVAGDGHGPLAALIQASDGLLYGTTARGGAYDWGTVFRTGLTGANYAVLLSFGSATFQAGPLFSDYYTNGYVPPPVGAFPVAPLLQAEDGTFYGTTMMGGNPNPDETPAGDPSFRTPAGTVFQLIPPAAGQSSWTVTYHFNFMLGGGNGDTPTAALIQTSPTTFRGTTTDLGSIFLPGSLQAGTIFELDRSPELFGLYTLYQFTADTGFAEGAVPVGALIESDGFFYGTTLLAGPNDAGTIFRMDAESGEVSLVHGFAVSDPGNMPGGPLIKGSDGDLYGAAGSHSAVVPFFGDTGAPGAIFRLHFGTDQTITFGTLANKTFGDADFSVSATASSGLTVSFGAIGSCTVTGASVHLTGAGSCTITASQAGDNTYNPALDLPRSFDIARGNQTITFAALQNKTVGDADFNVSASASSGLAVSFGATGACTITGATVHLTGAGSCTITASQAGDSNYNAAPSVPRTFNVVTPAVALALSATSVTGGTSVTATVTLTSPAPNGGAVVALASSAPGVASVPASITIMKGKTSGTFTIATVAGNNSTGVTISATYGTTASRPLTVIPVPPPSLSTLAVSPKAVKGGTALSTTVELTRAAPAGGVVVTLTSSRPTAVPNTTITVPAGATLATGQITTLTVSATVDITITAETGGVQKSTIVTVKK